MKFANISCVSSLSAIAIVVLSGCANNSTPAASASVAVNQATTLYCAKDRAYATATDHVCNWASSVAAACRDNEPLQSLPKSSVIGDPTTASRCSNGEWLVQITRKAG